MDFVARFSDLLGNDRGAITRLSETIGASTGLISAWKSGEKKPSFEYIPKLAEYFSVTTDYILCFSLESNPQNTKMRKKKRGEKMEREMYEIKVYISDTGYVCISNGEMGETVIMHPSQVDTVIEWLRGVSDEINAAKGIEIRENLA
jgi:transcriptional regulator with XRE-family HTH domain